MKDIDTDIDILKDINNEYIHCLRLLGSMYDVNKLNVNTVRDIVHQTIQKYVLSKMYNPTYIDTWYRIIKPEYY